VKHEDSVVFNPRSLEIAERIAIRLYINTINTEFL